MKANQKTEACYLVRHILCKACSMPNPGPLPTPECWWLQAHLLEGKRFEPGEVLEHGGVAAQAVIAPAAIDEARVVVSRPVRIRLEAPIAAGYLAAADQKIQARVVGARNARWRIQVTD